MAIPRRDWLTASEVAGQFGVSPQAVRMWILTGQLEGEQAPKGTWLIHESAVEQFRVRRHNCNTPPATRGDETSNRPSVSRSIQPKKRYRIRSTGEIVTGVELLRRRNVHSQ
jgi:hypothetical protein